jgi:hypothetical protein
MSKHWRRTLWLVVVAAPVALWLLPLGAQQTPEKSDSTVTAPAPEPEPAVDAAPTEERVSADNNLTFPVDI